MGRGSEKAYLAKVVSSADTSENLGMSAFFLRDLENARRDDIESRVPEEGEEIDTGENDVEAEFTMNAA